MKRRVAHLARVGLWVGLSLLVATAAVATLETWVGVPDASTAYLVAVVACGLGAGTAGAVLAATGAFLIYNYYFIEPLYTFTIGDPRSLLSLVLLLFVGIVVGQLAALERARAETATAREREARALFAVSRILSTRANTGEALGQIAGALRAETGMNRVQICLGPDPSAERITADTKAGGGTLTAARVRVLQRKPGDEPAQWALVVRPGTGKRAPAGTDTYRVRIEASGEPLGSIWAERERDAGEPLTTQTRLLAGAADQIGQAIARDRLAAETRAADLARQSDELKSSLLQSVSHDFRTPLAVIRAAAGSLDSDSALSPEDRRANVTAIEREVEYLNRLVTNLLDLSRIEAGALQAHRDVYDVDDLISQSVDRVQDRLGGRRLELAIDPVLVLVDPVLVDAALANVLDNAIKYTPRTALVRVSAHAAGDRVMLSVEDDGPGVPDDALPQLFTKFYRVPGAPGGSRGGLGIGLAVVRGLVDATGGRVTARRSDLGGLAMDIDLPAAATAPRAGQGTTHEVPA